MTNDRFFRKLHWYLMLVMALNNMRMVNEYLKRQTPKPRFAAKFAIAIATKKAELYFKWLVWKSRFTAFSLIPAIILCGAFAAPMAAYAYSEEADTTATTGNAYTDETDMWSGMDISDILNKAITIETMPGLAISPESGIMPTSTPQPTTTPRPLTPPGNLTLVDDISGEQTGDKQFITLITKSGNYFYLVIDRAGDKENVHFLNLVDEADLLAIIEKGKETAVTPAPSAPAKSEPKQTAKPAPENPQSESNTGGIVIALLLLGVLGGGAALYFKVLKPKQAAKGAAATELDEFSFDGDEDEADGMNGDGDSNSGGERDGADIDDDSDSGDYDDGIPDFTLPDAPDTGGDGGEVGHGVSENDSGGEPVPDFTFDTDGTGTDAPESEDMQ